MMRLSDTVDRIVRRTWFPRIAPAVDAQRSRQYDLAGRIASRNVDWKAYPKQWQIYFDRALTEIQQQAREFEEAR